MGGEYLLANICFQQGSQLPTAAAAVLANALLQVDNPAAAEACQPGVAVSGTATEEPWTAIRELLLQRSWSKAQTALATAAAAPRLILAEAVRLDFWHGFVKQQLGHHGEAERLWRQVAQRAPWSYYGWLSQVRLGQVIWPSPLQWVPPRSPTAPLGRISRDDAVTWLWNTGLDVLAWEHWRHWRGATAPQDPDALWIEGQLRLAVMDPWMGLEQLDAASWNRPASEGQLLDLEQVRHPIFYARILADAAQRHGLDPALLLAIARQESRFRPAQRSVVGALGLLQLMPATAAQLMTSTSVPPEWADQDLETQLLDAEINADLGARYLAEQLRNWRQQPILAIASYNAGPAAVAGWGMDGLEEQPELWIEAIPYAETRFYVKTVLESWWAYSCLHGTPCLSPPEQGGMARGRREPRRAPRLTMSRESRLAISLQVGSCFIARCGRTRLTSPSYLQLHRRFYVSAGPSWSAASPLGAVDPAGRRRGQIQANGPQRATGNTLLAHHTTPDFEVERPTGSFHMQGAGGTDRGADAAVHTTIPVNADLPHCRGHHQPLLP